jgi:iron complex outermembrane receptor protein
MRILLLLTTALFTAASAVAQGEIQGKITSPSGEALTGAAIAIEETFKGTFSGNDGAYRLRNLPPGRVVIRVSYLGYETITDTLNVVDDETVQRDFQLKTSAFLSEEVVISATRAGASTPTTYTNLSEEEISAANFGQDIPYILEFTPSAVVTSDAGAGVGYTGIRIRGTDPTRTNVTINGIPVNDAESHGVFWVNMPDLASSVENIQVQRGVGTSTNGAAAFGASLNIQTNTLNDQAYAEVENAYGSFNTWRHTVKAGTGLINNAFSVDARLSRITSDGYIDRASSDLKSYYLAGAWHGKNSVLRVNVFGGAEKTYQAWNGVSSDDLENNRTFNSAGMYFDEEGNMQFYDNEVDDYQQHHYQLHFSHRFGEKWYFNTSLHYTRGFGFSEQYREDDRFSTYGLDPVITATDTITNTDLIRRRWLDNHFYGQVFSLDYNNQRGLNVTLGGGWNAYDGDHFGEIIWARFASQSSIRDRYYDNNAFKSEWHAYLKATKKWGRFTAFADLQYRAIDYRFEGPNVVNEVLSFTDQSVNYGFFNPKAGVMFDLDERNNFYASIGVAHREPVRRDFTESTPDSRPTPEQLRNIEAGYRHKGRKWFLNANYFLMDYQDQLVLTGQVNDVGAYTRINIPDSYRMGIEIEGGLRISDKISLSGNAALSRNKIPSFTEFIDDFDEGGQVAVNHTNTDIAFSPALVAGGSLTYEPVKDLRISFMPRYVSEQFLDNTSDRNRMLDAYFISNLRAHYVIRDLLFNEIELGVLVYNLFDEQFENNGYTFSYVAGGETITENFYYPQAGINFLCSVALKF